nr:retrovirus-related Pol polyprotein from transposon TNT 1-94 [Tanacetum cinerariifolium]
RKGVVIKDLEEDLPSDTPAETPKVKDKGKGILIEALKPMKKKDQIEMDAENLKLSEARKNMIFYLKNTEGYKMDFFKGMKYDEILLIFQAKFDANMRFLFKSREEMEEEDQEIIKSINKTPAQKAAKRRKLSKEAQEAEDLRKRLEIVQDEDDDVFVEATLLAQKVPVVDYQIVVIDNKPRYKIKRADDTHQLYISFTTLLNNFDREDLETLWRIVRDRFFTSKPTNFSDEYILLTLKTMFEEPDGQDVIWRNQKSVHGLALVKRWKLLTSCGVHVITLSTVQLFLLVKRRYPLLRFTLEQLVNVVRLQVEEESEMSLELLSESKDCQSNIDAARLKLKLFKNITAAEEMSKYPDDEEDTKSSHEYMNDLEEEYQARALLAKSKSFFKNGTQRFSSAKATDQTKCHKCGKKAYELDEEEVSSYDNEMVEVKVLMELDEENDVVSKEGVRNDEWLKISMRKCDIRKPSWYLDSRCSRHMTGVKSYMHKYMEQPGPKVVFRDDSTCITEGYRSIKCILLEEEKSTPKTIMSFIKRVEKQNDIKVKQLRTDNVDNINIVENERYSPDECLHPYEPSQKYSTNINDVSFIEPFECPEPVVFENEVLSDQNGQTDQNDHNNQNDQSVKNYEILNDDHSEHFNHTNDEKIIDNLPNTKAPQDKWSQDKHIDLVNIIGKPGAEMFTRTMAKELGAASAHKCLFVDFLSEVEPKKVSETSMVSPNILRPDLNGKAVNETHYRETKKVSEALQHLGWVDSMQDELNQFARNKVWTLVLALYVKTPMVSPNKMRPDLNGKAVNETQYRGCDLKRYSYSNYAGCNMDRKSTSGACQLLRGKLPQFPLNYESEQGYNENYTSYPYDSSSLPQQYPCCTRCGGPHLNFQCQSMNQDSYSLGFDQPQPPQCSVIHQPPQELSIQEMEDLKQQYLEELKRLSNLEYRDEIKIAELTENLNGMSIEIRKKEKLLQQEQWDYLSTHPSKRLTSFCYNDDDDYNSAITPILSTKEPIDSLSMGDEHLDTIPATESDEVIKSSVEDLVPIPSESEGIPEHMCDVPFHDNSPPFDVLNDQIEDFSESNNEVSSNDDDSFSIYKIDYVEASPPDSPQ